MRKCEHNRLSNQTNYSLLEKSSRHAETIDINTRVSKNGFVPLNVTHG